MGEGQRRRVIIAEDEYLISVDVAETAREAGYEVVGVAPDGERAVELVRDLAPDVAIFDIKMPRMDGLQAAAVVRDRHPTPVVLMTAYESAEFVARAREAGVAAYLVKPPDAASLRRAVELAVARHADLTELRRVNAALTEALHRVRTLEGLLPICAWCKDIRDEAGNWQGIERYLHDRTGVELTHGLCPRCRERHFPEAPGGGPDQGG